MTWCQSGKRVRATHDIDLGHPGIKPIAAGTVMRVLCPADYDKNPLDTLVLVMTDLHRERPGAPVLDNVPQWVPLAAVEPHTDT